MQTARWDAELLGISPGSKLSAYGTLVVLGGLRIKNIIIKTARKCLLCGTFLEKSLNWWKTFISAFKNCQKWSKHTERIHQPIWYSTEFKKIEKITATKPQPHRTVFKCFEILKKVSHSLEPGETPSTMFCLFVLGINVSLTLFQPSTMLLVVSPGSKLCTKFLKTSSVTQAWRCENTGKHLRKKLCASKIGKLNKTYL